MITYTVSEIHGNRVVWCNGLNDESLGQVEGKLADETYLNFCCLGVAAEKVPALGCERDGSGLYRYTFLDPIIEIEIYGDEISTVVLDADLHHEILAKLGLSQPMQTFLIGLNDDAKMSFPQIGKVIAEMPYIGASDSLDVEWDRHRFLTANILLFHEASSKWLFAQLSEALEALENNRSA